MRRAWKGLVSVWTGRSFNSNGQLGVHCRHHCRPSRSMGHQSRRWSKVKRPSRLPMSKRWLGLRYRWSGMEIQQRCCRPPVFRRGWTIPLGLVRPRQRRWRRKQRWSERFTLLALPKSECFSLTVLNILSWVLDLLLVIPWRSCRVDWWLRTIRWSFYTETRDTLQSMWMMMNQTEQWKQNHFLQVQGRSVEPVCWLFWHA